MADHCAASPPLNSKRKRASWACALSTQALLCVALYAALSVGRPQTQHLEGANSRVRRRDPLDLYFVSVRGGFWPPQQQARLLEQMAKTVKTYNAEFVVNVSDLGEDDPLTQNATSQYPFLNITWYTTTASHGHMKPNFFKRIKIPSGQVLDIVGLDTGSLQNVYLSQQGCIGPYYHNGSTAFIGNPGPLFQNHHSHK